MNITVFVKEPGKAPEQRSVPNELAALQEIVGGYIETVTIFSDLVVICNEEGRLQGLDHNCKICGVDLCGTIILAGIQGENFANAPDEEKLRRSFQYLWRATELTKPEGISATVEWYRPADKLPEDDVEVLVVCTAKGKTVSFVDAMELACYDRAEKDWILESYPEIENVKVSWWCELPCVPDAEVEDDE